MGRRPGIVGLGRRGSVPNPPAAEVAAGNDKFDTTNFINEERATSPAFSSPINEVAVDNRVLSFPAVPGHSNKYQFVSYGRRVLTTWRFINDAVKHPVQPSDDFIVERAKNLLRNG